MTCSLVIDGMVTGTGTDVMGRPVAPLAWLANVLSDQGVALEAGQLILPGYVTKAEPVIAGSTPVADFGPLGWLTINFIWPPGKTKGQTMAKKTAAIVGSGNFGTDLMFKHHPSLRRIRYST